MSEHQEHLADLLEQYSQELESNPNVQPPQELDSQTIETIQKMNQQFASEPRPEFIASLRAQLDREAATLARAQSNPKPRGFFALPRWSFVGIGAAVVIALIAFVFFATRPPSVNAQELLTNARTALTDLTGVKSFQMTQTFFNVSVTDPNTSATVTWQGETKSWYAGPNKWRIETTSQAPNQPPYKNINVADGTSQWEYDSTNNTVTIQAADPQSFPAPSVLSLAILQQDMSNCYDPKVIGEESIAGRATYKVSLGPAKCRSAGSPELNGPQTIWIDKQTFFILKSEIRAVNSDQVTSSSVVTDIQYNLALPNDLFQFTPPADAKVNDLRPKPTPSVSEYQLQLETLAKNAAFPMFAPSSNPNGLVPRAPRDNAVDDQIELSYAPPGDKTENTPADTKSISIIEKRADYELVRNWTDGAEPMDLNDAQAWLRRGDFDTTTNLGSNSAVMVLRDGTLISISSFAVSPDQLIAVAKSLQPVAGGHAPLPNPTPPSLDEIRAQSDFPFFIPTYVPNGLTPEPPTSHQLQYHRADGSIALIVQNAKQGQGGMEQEARFKGDNVALPNGTVAHELGFDQGIIILWWDQDGGYTSLEGHNLLRDEMLKIAASMSASAELGQTEPPPALPTPTTVPAPSFTILQPSYLPEKMKVTQENIPTPDGKAAGIAIYFDPHPDGAPHDLMTLTEFPKSYAEDNSSDAQAVQQNIGGRNVTVIKRGQGCVTFTWIQNDTALTLSNPYDPPGEPGQVRYSCDQMQKVIASIQ